MWGVKRKMVNSQAVLFLIFSLNGIIIGLIFDFFRILRKSFKTSNFVTYIEDILFWIFTGISIIYFMYNFSNGSIRLYIFLGLILGFFLYILTVSKYIINFFVFIIRILKIVLNKLFNIIYIPIKFIKNFICSKFIKHFYILFLKLPQKFSKYINKNSQKMSKK